MSQIQFIHRGSRRYFLGGIPSLPFLALETFESMTLGGTDLANGWTFGGVVFTYAGPIALETFETSTLTNATPPGPDYGWLLAGAVQFTVTVTISAVFTDLGGTVTFTATPSSVAGSSNAYQWYQNGVALSNGGAYSGVTTTALVITGTVSGDYTTYTCQVMSLGYTATSSAVTLIDRATDWSNRVVVNGGVAPSAGTVTTLRTFWNGLITDGISGNMAMVNCIVPDNLLAMLTPFVEGAGLALWTNTNFVLADLSVNGLQGVRAGTKWINTGMLATALGSTPAVSWYAYTANGGRDYGSDDNTKILCGSADYTDLKTYGYNGSLTTNLVPIFASPGNGFYSDTRTGANAHNIYFARSTTAFASIGSESNAFAGMPALSNYVLGLNINNVLFDTSGTLLSFIAFHTGMSSANTQALYNRVQTMRTSLGGGFR